MGLKSWVVLRCAGSQTVDLSKELLGMGLEVWTPIWKRRKRLPRVKKFITVEIACLPSYVFVTEKSLEQIEALIEGGKVKAQIMVGPDRMIVRVQDGQLAGLREVSDYQETEAPKVPRPKVGQRLKMIDGPFSGMEGQVSGLTPSHAIVEFGDDVILPIHFPYLQLSLVSIHA